MGFIQKLFNFITSPTNSRTLIILLIVLFAIPLTVIFSQKQQVIRQRAAESQSVPSSECSPPYSGYLGCLTENGCNNVGISSHVSCSDENVQEGVYCYESTKQGQTCSVNEGSGTCDDRGNCVINPSTPTETPIPSQVDQSAPTEEIISPTATNIPLLSQTPTIEYQTPYYSTPSYGIPIELSLTPSPIPYCYLKNKGDADCDNKINDADEKIWEQEFVSELNGITTQKQSDFHSDGVITIADFNIWKTGMADLSLPH